MTQLPEATRPDGVLRTAARDLYPGYFALVMATGITSTVLLTLDLTWVSAILLVISVVCGLVLLGLLVTRAICFPDRLRQDLAAPDRAFAFFTIVAAFNVVGVRLSRDGHVVVPGVLLVVSFLIWLPLSYGIPANLILGARRSPVLTGVNGTWFIWIVGTQSLAVAAAALEPSLGSDLGPAAALAAFLMWSVGSALYAVVAALVLVRLLLLEVTPSDLNPPYWIAMGATAITVLAAAGLLDVPDVPVTIATRPALTGLAVMLWAFGSWLIPLLLLFSLWRHRLAGMRPSYGPPLWSVVFPLGMYSAASTALGSAAELPLVTAVGRVSGVVAALVWAVVFVAMLLHLWRVLPAGGDGQTTGGRVPVGSPAAVDADSAR